MKKQICALAAAIALGAFGSASAGVSLPSTLESNVVHWATVVFCEGYEDGQTVNEVCVGGHTGFVVREVLDVSLTAFPAPTGGLLSL